MDENIKDFEEIKEENGSIKISEEVISSIAEAAVLKVEGVHGLNGGFGSEIKDFFGKKSSGKGIKSFVSDEQISVDIHLIVKYGYEIPTIAWNVQEKVKEELVKIVGYDVRKVNIHIDGISFSDEIEKIKNETQK